MAKWQQNDTVTVPDDPRLGYHRQGDATSIYGKLFVQEILLGERGLGSLRLFVLYIELFGQRRRLSLLLVSGKCALYRSDGEVPNVYFLIHFFL